jgi:hypothetical protein
VVLVSVMFLLPIVVIVGFDICDVFVADCRHVGKWVQCWVIYGYETFG